MQEQQYFLEIENKFNQVRGRQSFVSSTDWQLMESWQKQGVPLHVILNSMDEVAANRNAQKQKRQINSMSYFKPEIEAQFAEWSERQIGKSTENHEFTEVENMAQVTDGVSETVEMIESLIEKIPTNNNFKEPLKAATAVMRGELLHLIVETTQKNSSLVKLKKIWQK